MRFAKPSASRPESSEIYLVCQGFTATVSAGKKLEVLRIVDDLGLWMRIPSQDHQSHVCRSFPMRNSFELGGFHRHGTHFHAEEVFPFSPAEMSNLVFWFDVCRVLRIIFPFCELHAEGEGSCQTCQCRVSSVVSVSKLEAKICRTAMRSIANARGWRTSWRGNKS